MKLSEKFFEAGGRPDIGKQIFEFDVVDSQKLSGRFRLSAAQEIIVGWGDGTQEAFSGEMCRMPLYAKDYGKPADTKIKTYAADEMLLTGFKIDTKDANIRFNFKDLPARFRG